MKVLSLFSGLGAFKKALKRQNIKYELINYCEIDKYASKSYSLIHNVSEELNLGDVNKVNEKLLPDFDLMTWGFPCTDISIAGKQEGFIDRNGNKTRSGLYYEGLRILKEKKPKYSIIENVKNLTGKKFKEQFKQILNDLENEGYNNYWKVLNAKDYGVPQNRERVFIISIRKDIDNKIFVFPEGFDNGIRLKDLLEENVDEKYYISQEKTDKLIEQLKNKEISNTVRSGGRGSLDRHSWDLVCVKGNSQVIKVGNTNLSGNGMNGCVYSDEGIAPTITTNKGEGSKILQIGLLDIKGNEQIRRVYSPNGISLTLNSMQGGNRQPKIIEDNGLIQIGMLEGKGFESRRRVYSSEGLSPTLHGIGSGGNTEPKILEENELIFVGGIDTTEKWIDNDKELSRNYKEGYRVYDSEGIACCQKTNGGGIGSHTGLYLENTYRIRKLTPLECMRLMGFDDKDYYILKDNKISNSQIYKMAGNSIVVNVLEEIFNKLLK